MSLLAIVALVAAQEAGSVTLEKKAKLSVLVRDVSRSTGFRIELDPAIEDKEVAIAVRDAGAFQALDALCRAHGAASYLEADLSDTDEEWKVRLSPEPCVEYPASYHGPFKVFASGLLRTRSRFAGGDRAGVRVSLALLCPPWIGAGWRSESEVDWILSEARDADGRKVESLDSSSGRPKVSLSAGLDLPPNAADTELSLGDFDVDRGLSLLRGEVRMTLPETIEVRVPLEAGKAVPVPCGTLAVESVLPQGDDGWRIRLRPTVTRAGSDLKSAFLEAARLEHDTGYTYLHRLDETPPVFEVHGTFLAGKPTWLKLYARQGERKVTVPFEIRGLRFPEKKE